MNEGDAAAVAAAFDLGSVINAPALAARGANGFIWKLCTNRGVYAVKRLQHWAVSEAVPFDIGVQLAAADAGIPLPRPVLTPDGSAIVDRTRAYEWVDLASELAPPVSPHVAREVGSVLGRLHRLGIPSPAETDPWYLQPPTLDDWRALEPRGSVAGTPWAAWLAEEIEFLDDVGRRVSEPATGPVVTCHLDFTPSNVLPSSQDGSLVVIDWENAGRLTADAELAEALLAWCTAGERVDLDAAAALTEGYGTTPTLTRASFHMAIVTHLNFLKVNLDHSLDAEQRGDFVDRWIDALQPDRLRERLRAIHGLLERL